MESKLRIYNTLSRKIEKFKSIEGKRVRIYICGPTVNDVPHLGHARQQITFDVLRKYLRFLGYSVKFVSNITDIEDKIIAKSKELRVSIKALTRRNLIAHLEDYKKIGVEKPTIQPKATEYITEMIELIKKLEENGYTYIIPGDGVYYDISKFKGYGKLSHQNTEDLVSGARIEAKDTKRNKGDFVLWKFSKKGEPSWDSPWSKGRPGWHIECSAMSATLLGLPLDIHGGGQDLIFPHHEDEIAQSEAAYGKKLANYWVHNGLVNVDKIKMSKSLGNFRTIRDILSQYSGEVLRYFVLLGHYRKPIDFSFQSLNNAKNSYERLKSVISEIEDDGKINEGYLHEFRKAMDYDLNTPQALSVLWQLVRDKNAEGKINTISRMDSVFGLDLLKKEKIAIPKEVKELAEKRLEARKRKDWKRSDELREKIKEKGFIVEDTDKGYSLKKI